MKAKHLSRHQVGLKTGFRSGLEETVSKQLDKLHIPYTYEKKVIKYVKPAKDCRYTPDFVITSNNIIVETKGRFLVADRMKHLYIKAQYPEYDIRFVFSNSKARLSKTSSTTYADWCVRYGFKYADKLIPPEWLMEKQYEVISSRSITADGSS